MHAIVPWSWYTRCAKACLSNSSSSSSSFFNASSAASADAFQIPIQPFLSPTKTRSFSVVGCTASEYTRSGVIFLTAFMDIFSNVSRRRVRPIRSDADASSSSISERSLSSFFTTGLRLVVLPLPLPGATRREVVTGVGGDDELFNPFAVEFRIDAWRGRSHDPSPAMVCSSCRNGTAASSITYRPDGFQTSMSRSLEGPAR